MEHKPQQTYTKEKRRHLIFTASITLLLLAMLAAGITMGSAPISAGDLLAMFKGQGDAAHRQIVMNIRLPRVLGAVLAGAALSLSGVVMQSILRNPLGSPFTLGISHAAAFGAAFAIVVLGAGATQSSASDAVLLNNPYIVTLMAFVWSLASTGLILAVAGIRGATPETMILTGIIAGSLFTAGTTAMQYFADDVQLSAIVFWTFGDMGRASWEDLFLLAVVVIPAALYFIRNSWNYNALDAGDETAMSLGVRSNRLRVWGMLLTSLITAFTVAFFGIIGFVGLVVPHIVRRFAGGEEHFLIPASALFGGLFLLAADILARTIIAPVVLPVGILTSFTGAPLFIWLLLRSMKRNYWG